MDLSLGASATLAGAALVLIIGRCMNARIGLLQKYEIPEPIIGGVATALLQGCGTPFDRGVSREMKPTKALRRHLPARRIGLLARGFRPFDPSMVEKVGLLHRGSPLGGSHA